MKGQLGAWRAPALDPMRQAFKARAGSFPEGALRVQDLLREWSTIQQTRNKVCHPYEVTRELSRGLRQAVENLSRLKVLTELSELKTNLRTQGAP